MHTRRFFLNCLAGGLATASFGGVWWANRSEGRVARWTRRILGDTKRQAPEPVFKPQPATWNDNRITLTWIGHATVLLDFYGIRILTDPVLSDRIGVALGMGTVGPKRYIQPALDFEELPPVDLILLSHAHMDHMDLPTLRRFPRQTMTISARNTSDILKAGRRTRIVELGWGERYTFSTQRGDLELSAFEVAHWGQRWPSETARGYNGYVLRREGKAVIFGGDTAATSSFSRLRGSSPFQVALMPIGAYRPWIRNHCTPEEALAMANAAGAAYVVPIHHRTFKLSEEPFAEPLDRLETALSGEPQRLALRLPGETFVCPAT